MSNDIGREPAFILNIEDAGTYTYTGKAKPGTADATAGWQIMRTTDATGSTRWALGDNAFVHKWTERTSISYS